MKRYRLMALLLAVCLAFGGAPTAALASGDGSAALPVSQAEADAVMAEEHQRFRLLSVGSTISGNLQDCADRVRQTVTIKADGGWCRGGRDADPADVVAAVVAEVEREGERGAAIGQDVGE